MRNDPEQDLVKYHQHLSLLARLHYDTRWRTKFSPSDVVQETLLKAYRDWDQYNGSTTGKQLRWLRRILANTLADFQRRFLTRQRDLALELSLEKILNDSAVLIGSLAFAEAPVDQVTQEELSFRVAQALSELPELQYECIVRHHLEGEPVSAVACELELSVPAVAGHLRRGLAQLRKRLDTSGSRAS